MLQKKYGTNTLAATHIRLGVGIILYNANGILYELRSDCKQWGIIGGGVEIGEEVEDALIREIKEETSLMVFKENLNLLGVYSNPNQFRIIEYPDSIFHAIDLIYYTKIPDKIKLISNQESLELRIFSFRSQPQNIVPPAKDPITDFLNLKMF